MVGDDSAETVWGVPGNSCSCTSDKPVSCDSTCTSIDVVRILGSRPKAGGGRVV